jgi:FkbM family methyltransferase
MNADALAIARQYHQAGDLEQATQLYRQILQIDPGNAEVWYLLGAACQSLANMDEARADLQQAVLLRPDHTGAHNHLGVIFAQEERWDDAVASFHQALRHEPDGLPRFRAETHHNLALALLNQDKLDEAIVHFQDAIRIEPDFVKARHNLCQALHRQGKLSEEIAVLEEEVRRRPESAEAHHDLGVAYLNQGQKDNAGASFEQALRLKPDFAEAQNDLGLVLAGQSRLDEAVTAYQHALRVKPDFFAAHLNLGEAYRQKSQFEEAAASFQQALGQRSDSAGAHHGLALVLMEQGKLDEAMASFRQALHVQPNFPQAHSNLGIVLWQVGRWEEANECFQEALRLKPDFAEACSNQGNVFRDQGRFDEALSLFDEALRIKPDLVDARWNRALTWLRKGDFENGWTEYEWRWQIKGFRVRPFTQPMWDGSSPEGKTILLHAEQGLGDTFQFVRYAPLVKQKGATVIVETQKPLLPLLARSPGIDQLVDQDSLLPLFDAHAPLLSLPRILGTTLATMPAEVPYLFPDPQLVEHWRRELSSYEGIKVGIAWQGNPKYRGDRHRSIPLAEFEPLGHIPEVRLFSLQKGHGSEQLRDLADRFPVTDLADRLDVTAGPFMDTAAVMCNLDLVISSDTAIVHLAGALGVPVWVALSGQSDWRWLLGREDCPWYPSMRLFRQSRLGEWHDVFQRICESLKELKAMPRSRRQSRVRVSGGKQRASKRRPLPTAVSVVASSLTEALTKGQELHRAGDFLQAEQLYRRVLQSAPTQAEAWFLLGGTCQALNRIEEAVSHFQKALELKPDFPDALNSLGIAFVQQRKVEEAVASFRQAARRKPDMHQAHSNLGNALKELGRLEEAIPCYREAVRLNPDFTDGHNNLGLALADLGQYDEALLHCEQAIRLRPDFAEPHQNRALIWLLQGRFEQGWPEYEWRWKGQGQTQRTFAQPLWDGAPLAGRTILLYAEQGLGDTLHFIRYAPLVQQRGGKVVVECQKALVPLLSSCRGIDRLVAHGSPLPPFDVHAPLLSLPRIFQTAPADIPAKVPYLFPDAHLVDHWRKELDRVAGYKIGIAWQGNPGYPGDKRRSIPLRHFTPLARVEGVQLVSLQKGPGTEQLGQVGDQFRVIDLDGRLDEAAGPFMDTAAVMTLLDLVITSDTAIAHLAGALGVPVWLALPAAPDWRWLLDRDNSPWYPSMRLFRQTRPGDWDDVFERISAALREHLAERASFKRNTVLIPGTPAAESAFKTFEPLNRLNSCRHGTMLYNINDTFVGRSLDLYGEWSEGELAFLQQFLKPGMVAVEVGANIGAHTVFLAQVVGPAGRVLAFEPQRILYQTMCANLALNHITNVDSRNVAVGKEAGEVIVPSIDYRREGNFGALELGQYQVGERVPLVALDSIDLPQCALIKIDVQGMEQDVLEGATATIARFRPLLYIENDRPDRYASLVHVVESLGYSMYWHHVPMFNPNNFARNSTNVFGRCVSRNVICCPKEKGYRFDGLPRV